MVPPLENGHPDGGTDLSGAGPRQGRLMPQKVRIALDAMGGDYGAPVVVAGADISLERHPETEFVMVGNRAVLEGLLAARPALRAVSRVVHTDVAVKMDDKPSQ